MVEMRRFGFVVAFVLVGSAALAGCAVRGEVRRSMRVPTRW
jgi:hypothetical protein